MLRISSSRRRDFVAVRGCFLELAPLREQPRRLRRIGIEAQHEMPQFFQVLPPARWLMSCPASLASARLAKRHTLRAPSASARRQWRRFAAAGLQRPPARAVSPSLAGLFRKWSDHLPSPSSWLPARPGVSPAATMSPAFTAMETTTDGPGACTTPPSSRVDRVRYAIHLDPVTQLLAQRRRRGSAARRR